MNIAITFLAIFGTIFGTLLGVRHGRRTSGHARLGYVAKADNADGHIGSSPAYWGTWVEHEGTVSYWLLTNNDVIQARTRAIKFPEDRP